MAERKGVFVSLKPGAKIADVKAALNDVSGVKAVEKLNLSKIKLPPRKLVAGGYSGASCCPNS